MIRAFFFDDDEIAEAFAYLDDLRSSGQTNMFGATPYIANDLEHDIRDARKLLLLWMSSDLAADMSARVAAARKELSGETP